MALDVLGDLVGKAARALFGSRNERLVRGYRERIERAAALEPAFEALSDDDLKAKTAEFRLRLTDGAAARALVPGLMRLSPPTALPRIRAAAEALGGGADVTARLAEGLTALPEAARADWAKRLAERLGDRASVVAYLERLEAACLDAAKDQVALQDLEYRREPPGGADLDAAVALLRRLLPEAGGGTEEGLREAMAAEEKHGSLARQAARALVARHRERLLEVCRDREPAETLDDLVPEAFAAAREAAKRCVWLDHAEAPPDYHPEVQQRIRKAMRGEESLVDPETGKRIELHGLYSMRPYDVQLIGALVLNEGKIAEMVTGEGKTLVASLAAYLNALSGRPVHVVSTNDYLVETGRSWNEPVFRRLGMTVGAIQAGMDPEARQKEYACDITYGTNNEFGFDYLRDNMKDSAALQVQGDLAFAIVDEADSVLIDEARTPLIISGPTRSFSGENIVEADKVARQLQPGRDFEVKEKERSAPLTDRGVRRVSELLAAGGLVPGGQIFVGLDDEWQHLVDQALRAHHLYHRDKHYVVRERQVIIVDEFTGRLMPGRQWSDGLHQAVEAKHGLPIQEETQTLATITIQNFFRMYDKLSGMTGTAMTEAIEFDKIYTLEVVSIPTHRPLSRKGHGDVIYRTFGEKQDAVIDEIWHYAWERNPGRPVLVGTTSIQVSEELGELLRRKYKKESVDPEGKVAVLNARYHGREAAIVAKAGEQFDGPGGSRKGKVTIATNMAGRGTDIKLGPGVVNPSCFGPWNLARQNLPDDFGHKCCVGCTEYDRKTNCAHCFKPKLDPRFPKMGRTECVADPPCGLHVVGTERHEARRIDNQLRGRAGRQGDPGSGRFFLSLEDDLMRIFAADWLGAALEKLGMEQGAALEHSWLTKGIERAQKKVEERNFDIRKNLIKYDEVMDEQRTVFYGRRQTILTSPDLRDFVWDLLTASIEDACDAHLDPQFGLKQLAAWAAQALHVDVAVEALARRAEMEAADLEAYLKDEARRAVRETVEETLDEFVAETAEAETLSGAEVDTTALARWAQDELGLPVAPDRLEAATADEVLQKLHQAARRHLKGDEREDAALRIDDRFESFLVPDEAPGGEGLMAFRLEGVAAWAAEKFGVPQRLLGLHALNRDEIRARLDEAIDRDVRDTAADWAARRIDEALEAYTLPSKRTDSRGNPLAELDGKGLLRRLRDAFGEDLDASLVEGGPEAVRSALHAWATERFEGDARAWARGEADAAFDRFVALDHRRITEWCWAHLGVELKNLERQAATRGQVREAIAAAVDAGIEGDARAWARDRFGRALPRYRHRTGKTTADGRPILRVDRGGLETWLRGHLGLSVQLGRFDHRDVEGIRKAVHRAIDTRVPRGDARTWAMDLVDEALDEFVAFDLAGLGAWARTRLGLTVTERTLTLRDRGRLADRVIGAAEEVIASVDCAEALPLLDPDHWKGALAAWASRTFRIDLAADAFDSTRGREAVLHTIVSRVRQLYDEKEFAYPIENAVGRFLAGRRDHPEPDWEGLAAWASRRFVTRIDPAALRGQDRDAVLELLMREARACESEQRLSRTIRTHVTDLVPEAEAEAPEAWQPLAEWMTGFLGLETPPAALPPLFAEVRGTLAEGAEGSAAEAFAGFLYRRVRQVRRAPMTEFERFWLLQTHDTAWKDHLLVMDRLRESVGLRGYAQQDPLIEFKREGLENFQRMLAGVRDTFVGVFFQTREVRRAALAGIYAGQSASHAIAESVYDAAQRRGEAKAAAAEQAAQADTQAEPQAVQTIVRDTPKVGRNDPCPCGSGKKYKKCCGRKA